MFKGETMPQYINCRVIEEDTQSQTLTYMHMHMLIHVQRITHRREHTYAHNPHKNPKEEM